MTTVELRGVSKVHGDGAARVVAVEPTELRIDDGEFFAIIGPSGCGKTTMLRMIAGIERPSEGQVLLDGEVVNDIDARGRDVAMTFQSSALYPNLTVADNIGFSLRIAKVRRAARSPLSSFQTPPLSTVSSSIPGPGPHSPPAGCSSPPSSGCPSSATSPAPSAVRMTRQSASPLAASTSASRLSVGMNSANLPPP